MKLLGTLVGGLATVVIGGAMIGSIDTPAQKPATVQVVDTSPTCENRGIGHRNRHGGLEDDRYHRAKGEQVTCSDDSRGDAGSDRDNHAGESDRSDGKVRDRHRDTDDEFEYHRRDKSVKPNAWDMFS